MLVEVHGGTDAADEFMHGGIRGWGDDDGLHGSVAVLTVTRGGEVELKPCCKDLYAMFLNFLLLLHLGPLLTVQSFTR